MKKKILLIVAMFLFITNVNALSFSVNIVDIEDKGNNGTLGSIEKIDFANKELDVFFQDIGDEVNFELTITNSGDKAGTLKDISITSTNDKIEYTTNLPDGGLAIDANDTNKVIVTAKVKEGAVNGTSSSEVKITYNYDKGSCPDGEILSRDESMCLCPEGLIRNEKGVCSRPDKETIECADDEIYNESKKTCEKKETPVPTPTPDKKGTPSNPKTMDNIILITLLFVVSGLGIYAVLFKKLKTDKKKIAVGVLIGVLTLGTSFTVLASVFGLDNLLSAIVNPITKKQELIVTVNEKIDLIETWDGGCSLTTSELTPENIFEGGSGSPSDPYQIKTANQLACFAQSVNNGNTYAGQYIKQTKNIKLNDKVLENVEGNNISTLNEWTPIGQTVKVNGEHTITKSFNGTYDGNGRIISGLFINDSSKNYIGLFGGTIGATIKNLNLSDAYIVGQDYVSMLIAFTEPGTTIENVKTYGKVSGNSAVASMIAYSNTTANVYTKILNSENYADITANSTAMGFATFGCVVISGKNYGAITGTNIAAGISSGYIIDSENHGLITGENSVTGITYTGVAFSSDNYGTINGRVIDGSITSPYGFSGINASGTAIDCNNYGDIDTTLGAGVAGVSEGGARLYKSGNTGTITVHNQTINNTISVGSILSAGTNMMSDSDMSSYLDTYQNLAGKAFVARNNDSYNTGDIYITDSVASDIYIGMVSSNGCSNIHDVQNSGSMYITNVTSQGTSDYFTMIGNSGNSNTNVRSTGDIIIDNFTGFGTYIVGVGEGGPYIENSSTEGTIEVKNSTFGGGQYNSKATIAVGASAGARVVSTSTKGNLIIHDNHFINGVEIGGVLAGGAMATTSYNETDIEVYNNTSTAGSTLAIGGLATSGGMGVTNCYNRGNITVYDNSFDTVRVAGGVAGEMGLSGGNYNSGNIYVKDNYATTVRLGGATSYQAFNNFYNLGDITFETENNTKLTTLSVGGINDYGHSGSSTFSNLVNTGNITIPYVSSITNLSVGGVYGIFRSPYISNAYSSGTITIGDGYTYSDGINYGNLYGTQGVSYNPAGATPAAYYTQDGYAMGLSRLNSTYEALDVNYGTKVAESQVPSILSIINAQDVFEIKEGETLPTLKVFNQ